MSFILHNHVSTNIIFGHEPTSLMVYSGNNIAELGRERKRKKKGKKKKRYDPEPRRREQ